MNYSFYIEIYRISRQSNEESKLTGTFGGIVEQEYEQVISIEITITSNEFTSFRKGANKNDG